MKTFKYIWTVIRQAGFRGDVKSFALGDMTTVSYCWDVILCFGFFGNVPSDVLGIDALLSEFKLNRYLIKNRARNIHLINSTGGYRQFALGVKNIGEFTPVVDGLPVADPKMLKQVSEINSVEA